MEAKLGLIAFALVLVLGIGSCAVKQSTITTVTDTYQGFERINKGNESYYLMYFDNEVFKNEDDWMNGKFNSSDLCRILKKGETYELTVKGWRNEFWTWYRNIIKVEDPLTVHTSHWSADEETPDNGGSMKLTP